MAKGKKSSGKKYQSKGVEDIEQLKLKVKELEINN